MTTRKEFLASAAAFAAAGASAAGRESSGSGGVRIRFLGTGSARWNPAVASKPGARRFSSILVENSVMIDCSTTAFDKMPAGCRPQAIFLTHSHQDHYNPAAVAKSGAERVYAHESWAAAAEKEIADEARKAGRKAPRTIPLAFAQTVEECGMKFTIVPSNHSTSRLTNGVLERTGMYLVEKGASRILYATDTAGIPGDSARMIGIDPHIGSKNPRHAGNPFIGETKPLTGMIMEATSGIDDEDFRMFAHSSVQTVSRTANMLLKHKRLVLPPGGSVFITHLALRYYFWPPEKIDAELPRPLRAAADGMEVVL